MLSNKLGYIFECRQDSKGTLGVMESYNIRFKGNIQVVSIITAIDVNGNVVVPAYNDLSLGFIPLSNLLDIDNLDESVTKFVRSNKPYFSKFGTFNLIVKADISFARDTGGLLYEDSIVNFYAPKTASTNITEINNKNNGKPVPALICDKVSVSAGINTFPIAQELYNAYKMNFLKKFTALNTKDRISYIKTRIER